MEFNYKEILEGKLPYDPTGTLTIPSYARIKAVAERERAKEGLEYFPIQMPIFDEAMAGGFRDGEMITVTGFTGRGKTTFCQYITKQMEDQGVPTFWFSHEMQTHYLYDNFIKMGLGEDPDIYVPEEIKAYDMDFVEYMITSSHQEACKVYFIDHLHYLVPLTGDGNYVSFTIGNIVRRLKQLAKQYNKIIVLIAHTKKDDDDEVHMSDIRDSSLVAQESDYVYLVHRMPNEDKTSKELMTNKTKITLAKNRRTGKQMRDTFIFENNNYRQYEELKQFVPTNKRRF